MIIPEEDRKEILALLAIDAIVTGAIMPEVLCINGEEIVEVIEGLEGFDELFNG